MKYIKSFETEAAYEAGKGNLSIPYVAYTQDDEQVHYARRLEDMYDIVGTLVPGTTEFTFKLNGSTTVTPTIIGNRFGYNWTGGTITSLQEAFRGKTALVSIDKFDVPVNSTATTQSFYSGCINLTGGTLFYDGQTSIGQAFMSGCTGTIGALVIPDGIKTISKWAFRMTSGYTSVHIPPSLTNVGEEAFTWSSGLTGVYITDIASWAKVAFGNQYSNPLFYAHNLYLNEQLITNIIIPNTVTSIGNYAFVGFNAPGQLTIPDSVTTIGSGAFQSCANFTGSLTIPNSVTAIGNDAFAHCSGFSGSLIIPDSVTTIAMNAFSGCKGFTGSLTIGNSVTTIGGSAFYGCSGLTSVTIPDTVTTLGISAFNYCNGLLSITCLATTPPSLGSSSFHNTNNCPIYVPAASVETYKAASGWSSYASRIQAIPTT